jgi:hypothetical protein
MSRTCVFCERPVTGERGTGMNVRSARRLLGEAPPAALAETDGAGNPRWFGHAACASEAGGKVGPPSRAQSPARSWTKSRAERLAALLVQPIPDTHDGVARMLARLAIADNAGYHALTEAQRERYHDRSYLDELLAAGTEPEPALRARVRVREIGHHLDELGGKPLMRDVLHLAEELSPRRILRGVEMCWDGIGDWRG